MFQNKIYIYEHTSGTLSQIAMWLDLFSKSAFIWLNTL